MHVGVHVVVELNQPIVDQQCVGEPTVGDGGIAARGGEDRARLQVLVNFRTCESSTTPASTPTPYPAVPRGRSSTTSWTSALAVGSPGSFADLLSLYFDGVQSGDIDLDENDEELDEEEDDGEG